MSENYPPTPPVRADWDVTPVSAAAPAEWDVSLVAPPSPWDVAPKPATAQEPGKVDVAKDQAAAVGQGAARAGQQVTAVAKDQMQNVAVEAGSQAKDLLTQAQSELIAQAGSQQKQLASILHDLADELHSMASGAQSPGMASNIARRASTRGHDIASWLEAREPAQLVQELQNFARQRPGAFLALAASAGLVAGRLGRGVKDATGADEAETVDTATTGSTAQLGESSPAISSGYGAARYTDPEMAAPFASSRDQYADTGTVGQQS